MLVVYLSLSKATVNHKSFDLGFNCHIPITPSITGDEDGGFAMAAFVLPDELFKDSIAVLAAAFETRRWDIKPFTSLRSHVIM